MADDNIPVDSVDQGGSGQDSRAAAIANALATNKVGETEQQTPEQAEADADPWAPKLAPVKIASARDRILAKQSAQQAAQQSQTLQAQFDQLQARLTEVTGAEQNAMAKFQEHLDKGDVEAALKVKGLPVSFEDLQRAKLKAMGALSDAPRDPRVDAMAEELRALKEEKQKQQEAFRQRREQEAQQREWQEGVAQVKAEIEALELPGAKALVNLHGFSDSVLAIMTKNPEASVEQAAALVRRDYQALWTNLQEAFGGGATPAQQQPAGKQTLAQSVASRAKPRQAAPNPLQNLPDDVPLKDRRARALDMALKGLT